MKSLTKGHLKSSWAAIRSAKLRNFWTMFGVIVGVASVITVVSIGEGVKHQVSHQIHQFGKNLLTIRPAQLQAGNEPGSNLDLLTGSNIVGTLSQKDVATVSRVPGVGASAPLTAVPGQVTGDNGVYKDGLVIGTSNRLPSLLNQSLAYGGFFDDDHSGINVAVIGTDAADKMFNEDVPLGRSFGFHGERFVVMGIFNTFAATPLSGQVNFDKAIFIPYGVAENLTNGTAPTYEILAKPSNPKQIESTLNNVRRALTQSHGGQSDFSVLKANQNLAASSGILELLTRLIAGVAAISLLVGGIGIMDVMIVTVAERQKEIGIRKAVGATNRQILSQFMVEAGLLTLVGGIVGIIVSGLINILLRLFTDLQPFINWQIVVVALLGSLVVGVVFGTVPAAKAARKDPIEALRSE
ncbi:MAG TPA: ABC transporter permease [Candidatus Saccharimonadales bacterium]|nr:ABC transporter permease [Candidatus Saccharimonadales bacterium]